MVVLNPTMQLQLESDQVPAHHYVIVPSTVTRKDVQDAPGVELLAGISTLTA